jgi:hypothetical protein
MHFRPLSRCELIVGSTLLRRRSAIPWAKSHLIAYFLSHRRVNPDPSNVRRVKMIEIAIGRHESKGPRDRHFKASGFSVRGPDEDL